MADITNQSESFFRGDPTKVSDVDIDAPLSQVKTAVCEYYSEPFGVAAKVAEDKGDSQAAAIYRFLQVVVGFCPSFDTPSNPFVPFFQGPGGRTPIPADLSEADIDVLRSLAQQARDNALQARLLDLLWELKKDHAAGAKAAACYATSAEKLDSADDWPFAETYFKRALYLASKFGRNKPLFEETAKAVVEAAKRSATSTDAFHCLSFMRLLIPLKVGDPGEFANISAKIAAAAQAAGDLHKAKAYWDAEADWRKLAKDTSGEQKARLAAAEAAVSEAEARSQGKGASFMAAASLMSKAIEQMRRAGAPKERIAELRLKMNQWQERSLEEFQTFSTEFDISDMVIGAREHVKGEDFPTAVLKLAFGHDLSDPAKLKEEVKKNAEKAPFTYLIGGVTVDQKGRTTARKEGLFNLTGEALEQALEAETFSHASHYNWPLRVDAFIEPARMQILNDHKPSYGDLLFIARDNPFIPPGHEGIFLRGLHAGFHGDFVVASHLLTPQIENSLRYVLESAGVDVSNLMSDGTQPVKILGAIFDIPQTKQIFGASLCFELRGSLIEKSGFDFRNRVAHGFVQEAECYSAAGVTAWWLVLRLCLMPIYHAMAQQKQPLPTDPEGTPHDSSEQPPGTQ